ncbi:hypothetical protein DPMN_079343 [Dreissena polymorpha]|uniref:Uncharacterized protein n=1 Tax=Dreissena polymorpha TaxID=45954 RepID=A0A9D3YNW2_DREPO|nr:hypothetical protein DPMN_079343 [Dreissena polymorpha]
MDPGPSAVGGQPFCSVGVSHHPPHDYLHVVDDEYDEIKCERTVEVNSISQSADDNIVYHEIDPDDITERQGKPTYMSLQMRETHLYDVSFNSSNR